MTGTGRPAVTAFWYPGFVPANAFALTGDGLVWTVDVLLSPIGLLAALRRQHADLGRRLGVEAASALLRRTRLPLAEIARLGRAMGADPLTFAGLAGMGERAGQPEPLHLAAWLDDRAPVPKIAPHSETESSRTCRFTVVCQVATGDGHRSGAPGVPGASLCCT